MSVGRMRISGVFCFDTFAVILKYRTEQYNACVFFTSILLDYTSDTLRDIRIGLDVEGTIPTDTVVRALVDHLSTDLSHAVVARTPDGQTDYAGEVIDGVRTYARWVRSDIDIRLIESRWGLALRASEVRKGDQK